MSLLDGLTPPQREAVEHVTGPLLILAGPGSGKTRVVTRRIAWLVEQGVPDRNILAITFTNKAANEMRERVEQLLPGSRVWVSTFHRFCARLLRQHANILGLDTNFSILDTADQRLQMRQVVSELGFDPTHYAPDKLLWRISNAKNDCESAAEFKQRIDHSVGDHLQVLTAQAYQAYQQRLLAANAVDFDDLLLHTVRLLDEHPEIRSSLDRKYQFVLVDEYQDTNLAQYRIARALSQEYPNLCVTGDPDQSIYGWRGARIGNIFAFRQDFPNHRVIPLEQNFRSTSSILRVADQLIAHNQRRLRKELRTENPAGTPPQLLIFPDSQSEAEGLATRIRALVEQPVPSPAGGSVQYGWKDVAVFFRVNALSRQLEQAFLRHRIPFQLATGFAFYERAEVKDLLGYLRLIHNPADRAAFGRVVNTPLRGLGETSQKRLMRWADSQQLTLLEAAARAKEVPQLSKAAVVKFPIFARMIEELSSRADGSVADLLTRIVEQTRFTAGWLGSGDEADQDKLANVEELISAARHYDEYAGDSASLEGFLEQVALVSDIDSIDRSAGEVTLMTLHAAKGLEFPVVFIIGVEEGLIPHERSLRENNRDELEEERRLLFVGMTRAEQQLYLTQSRLRSMHGRTMPTIGSPFVDEIQIERVLCEGEEPVPGYMTHLVARGLLEPPGKSPIAPAAPPVRGELPGNLLSKLKTGAELEQGGTGPTGKALELLQGYSLGMQVRHPKYGLGTVINLQGMGLNRTVTVRFAADERVQDFVSRHAPLQPVGT